METLLPILADPETQTPVVIATAGELAKLRAALADGRARRRNGAPIEAIEGACLSADRKVAYLIESGIPNFVIDERIEIEGALE
jgi:uncharacterized protein YbaR (Trm112 family)